MTLAAMTYYLLLLILGLPIGVWCAGAWKPGVFLTVKTRFGG